jgi:hypothetical protein
MIQQLVRNLVPGNPDVATDAVKAQAAMEVLTADPLDLVLYMEQVWDLASAGEPGEFTGARRKMWQQGRFAGETELISTAFGPWDHFIYAYVLESTRAVQIFKRIVREYRSGERLGIPTRATQFWLDATEALLFGAANPVSAWLSTSTVRQDPEAIRRNAYWRMFGLDLSFGADDNSAPIFDKAKAANTTFTGLFEELLFELWQAISNQRNLAGVNQADNDRIFRLTEELRFILTSRRQEGVLRREELSAVTALGWAELTVSFNTPIVQDLGAEGSSPGDRLRLMGERVGLPAHSRSTAFFSMSAEISKLLRVIEAGIIADADSAWVLYTAQSTSPIPGLDQPIGTETRRVITEWSAATGKNLKERSKPIDVRQQPRLVAVP